VNSRIFFFKAKRWTTMYIMLQQDGTSSIDERRTANDAMLIIRASGIQISDVWQRTLFSLRSVCPERSAQQYIDIVFGNL